MSYYQYKINACMHSANYTVGFKEEEINNINNVKNES